MAMSQREAARMWSIPRANLQRAIASGKLSLTSDRRIDASEMVRVFGNPEPAQSHQTGPFGPPSETSNRVAILEAELAGLRATLAAKDAHIEDLRGQVRLLTHDGAGEASPRKRWWSWR